MVGAGISTGVPVIDVGKNLSSEIPTVSEMTHLPVVTNLTDKEIIKKEV